MTRSLRGRLAATPALPPDPADVIAGSMADHRDGWEPDAATVVLTLNEMRCAANLPPIPGGDVPAPEVTDR